MHLMLVLVALGAAIALRWRWQPTSAGSWAQRWAAATCTLLLPPLGLLSVAIAIVVMGWQGRMFHVAVGWYGYGLAVGWLAIALLLLAQAAWQAWRTEREARHYPLVTIAGATSRLLPTELPFAAQVGVGSPQLLVSQGLLDSLTPAQVAAVLAHEQAHVYYRDTFWGFWWGWLRRLTAWLPRTQALWQELLLLRELRADAWAAARVEPLLLAEALLQVVQGPAGFVTNHYAAFGEPAAPQRLVARIEALLAAEAISVAAPPRWWLWSLAIAPLVLVFWHH